MRERQINILLIADSYPPEIRSASHLMQELAEGLKDNGCTVFVATSFPQYNLTEEVKDKIFNEVSDENGIKVIRIKTLPHHNVNFLIRGISQITMPYIFLRRIIKYIDKIDFVIVYSPPLPLSIVGLKIKRHYKSKFILNVQDIFPQNAVDLGILKNKLIIKYFEKIEKKAYLNADMIFAHSEGNIEFIRNKFPEITNKLKVIHNWINVKEYNLSYSYNKLRKELSLDGKYILLFAGVIGLSQGLEFVLKLANELKNKEDIVFLIVGDGMEKEKLKRIALKLDLKNVLFKSFVSKEEYPKLLKECDVGLVSLTNKNKTPVVPGKILGYMAAGIPLLAFINKESDGHKIIRDANCGYSSVWGDIETAKKNILKLYQNKEKGKELGINGNNYIKNNFSIEIIINQILNQLVSKYE